jgi:hypothetical protein
MMAIKARDAAHRNIVHSFFRSTTSIAVLLFKSVPSKLCKNPDLIIPTWDKIADHSQNNRIIGI